MMTLPNNEIALNTLLNVAKELAPEFDQELIKQVFLIQQKYQFDDDRSLPLREIKNLVDKFVSI